MENDKISKILKIQIVLDKIKTMRELFNPKTTKEQAKKI
jgi:hypothetical protein